MATHYEVEAADSRTPVHSHTLLLQRKRYKEVLTKELMKKQLHSSNLGIGISAYAPFGLNCLRVLCSGMLFHIRDAIGLDRVQE